MCTFRFIWHLKCWLLCFLYPLAMSKKKELEYRVQFLNFKAEIRGLCVGNDDNSIIFNEEFEKAFIGIDLLIIQYIKKILLLLFKNNLEKKKKSCITSAVCVIGILVIKIIF